ncbi:MAG: hypothetical protein HN644_13740 [Rhodospirillales bacterium]|jgi:ABC-type uncharacterized transport system auxiliary subunit|nr:hypothetical protein [Rhodospirillales bacterium]MBT4040171.1 hypothetical protein [Rhodospirillales bacterium]MBT4628539.1 hypothetical protein [Rhodospirillales bacterium]MBT5352667.1 hypothetical protein [Rhodospirillales bacterium]MBT5521697.1 hypothetical protein [Rhodospirillales bacterium]
MTMISIRTILLNLTLVVLVSACTAQPPATQDRYYRISVGQPSAAGTILSGTLVMEPFVAEGLVAGRAIIHVESEDSTSLQEYNYDFWAEPPGIMIRDELMAYLRDANVAGAIVTPEMRAQADYILSGHVSRLEMVRGPEPKAYVELDIAVTKDSNGKVVMVKSYGLSVAASDGTVKAGVAAANQGIEAIFEQFLKDLNGG